MRRKRRLAVHVAVVCSALLITAFLGQSSPQTSAAPQELAFKAVMPVLAADNSTGAQATLALSKFGVGQVTSDPSRVSCLAGCDTGSWTFGWGSTVRLTASSSTAQRVLWTGCDSVSGNICTVSLNGDRQTSVAFAARPEPQPESNTKVLSPEQVAGIRSIDANRVLFSPTTPGLDAWKPGDVLVSGTGEGFLRRLTAIEHSTTAVIVSTEAASLDDAFGPGTILASWSDGAASQLTEGATGAVREGLGGGSPISLTLSGGLSLTGALHVEVPEVALIHDSEDGLTLSISQVFTLEATIKNSGSVALSRTFTDCGVPRIKLGAYSFFVGPVPIVLTPVISVPCKLEVNLSTANQMSISNVHRETIVFRCRPDLSCTASSQRGEAWGYNFASRQGSASVQFSVGPEISLLVYGVTGPYFNVSLFAKLQNGVSSPFTGSISAGVEASTGLKVELKVGFVNLASKVDLKLARAEVILASWSAPNVGVVISGLGSVTGPGIRCPSDCTDKAEPDKTVTLTAVEDRGRKFGRWEGCSSTNGLICQVRISGDRVVTAFFSDASTGGGGSDPNPPPIVVPIPMSPPRSFPGSIVN